MFRIRCDPLFPQEYVAYESTEADPHVASLLVPMIGVAILFALFGAFWTKTMLVCSIFAGVGTFVFSNRVLESFFRVILIAMVLILVGGLFFWLMSL